MILSRLKPIYCFSIVLLLLALVSCKNTNQDSREALSKLLKAQNIEGFHFEATEDDDQEVASFTNGAVRKLIKLDKDNDGIVLRYTSIKDKKANSIKTYKTEVLKKGDALTLLVTDIESGENVVRQNFPAPTNQSDSDETNGASSDFKTLDQCFDDFNCNKKGTLQCEANRTCKPQYWAILCPIGEGEFISVHFIITPTSLKCRFAPFIPKFEGIGIVKKQK